MATLDWIIVALFLLSILGIGLYFSKKASGSLDNFFLSGRSLPWWLAGTSILATSFASDTPLSVTKELRNNGLGGAWFFWTGILTHLVVTFFFARMWRRTEVVTDAEFIELRYSGRAAATLRGLVGGVRGLLFEAITLAWVIKGMEKVVVVVLDLPPTMWGMDSGLLVIFILMFLVLVYSVSAGLWGVVVTDFIEFVVAMVGAIALAAIAYYEVGGPSGLREGLAASPGGESMMDFFPDFSTHGMGAVAFAVFLGVQWWANDSIDGSGKRAQRFLACKTEKDALASGVWNVAVQWILRTWPWYLAAMVSIVLYPEALHPDGEKVYPLMIKELMPIGLKGLMIAAFLAAFMSTVDTHLNLCSAYLTNDVYKRFVKPGKPENHYVGASKFILIGVAFLAAFAATNLDSVLNAFKFKMELMSGIGLVILARWFWWRVTAWAEVTAVVSSISGAIVMRQLLPDDEDFPLRLLCVVAFASVAWITVALMAKPESPEHLKAFYSKVRPPSWGWGPIRDALPNVQSGITASVFVQMGLCALFAFCGMFSVGKLLFAEWAAGIALGVVSAVSGYILVRWLFLQDEPPVPEAKTIKD